MVLDETRKQHNFWLKGRKQYWVRCDRRGDGQRRCPMREIVLQQTNVGCTMSENVIILCVQSTMFHNKQSQLCESISSVKR